MKARGALGAALLAWALLGCDEPVRAVMGAPAREVGPSPLVGADPDRLRLIVFFSKAYLPECEKYFEAPTDPRYIRMGLGCEGASLELVDWLRANGFPSVQPEHVRAAQFYASQRAMDAKIERCTKAVFARSGSAAIEAASQCDPVVRLAERGYVTRPEFAGIRRPAGE